MNRLAILFTFLTVFIVFNCENKDQSQSDTATYGEINIACDESFKPIIEAELDVFHSEYYNAKINTSYVSEGWAFKKLLSDSVRLIIASRTPNENELTYFKNKQIIPKINKIASDAVVLIVSNLNNDSLMKMSQLKAILHGKTSNWNEINRNNTLGKINLVFDNNNSSNLQFLKNKFGVTTFTSNVASAGSHENVVSYLESHPNAIGVIGMNWISDTDDKAVKNILSKVRILAISEKEDAQITDFYSPYQGEISLKNYPLSRDFYIISRESRTGLGTGFNAFVMGERGQRIILKAGLVPAIMPYREVTIKHGMP